jgi:hypothetical protein
MGTNVSSERMGILIQSVQETLRNSLESILAVNMDLKVLAINAKIQAARVGAAGVGFSVVANEMERLSAHTQGIIESLYADVERAVQSLMHLENQTRGRRLSQVASNCIEIVDRSLYERSCNVRWWATDNSLITALTYLTPEQFNYASQRLATILETYTVYFDLILCDLNGNVVCNGRPKQYNWKGFNLARREWFTQIVHNTTNVGYSFQGPINSEVNKQPVLVYSCGVREAGSNGKLLGVLAGVFNWDGLGKKLLTQVETVLSTETEDPVYAFLCRPDATVVSASNSRWVGKKLPISDLAEICASADGFKEQKDHRGNSTLVGVAMSRGFETYKTGWVSVIVESTNFN